jgi:hypothetical protein
MTPFNTGNRRIMPLMRSGRHGQAAGMRQCGQRTAEEAGGTVEFVVSELLR